MHSKSTYSRLLDSGYVIGNLSCDTVKLVSSYGLDKYFKGKEKFLFGDIKDTGGIEYDYTRTYRTWGPSSKEEDTDLFTEVEKDIVQNCPVFSTGKKRRAFVSIEEYESTYTLIQSVAGVTRQCWHTDYDISRVAQFLLSSTDRFVQVPLVALVALEDDTYLPYIPGSHSVLCRGGLNFQEEKVLTLKKGQYILFHPLLIHRGAAYSKKNRRLHIYFDRPVCPRSTTKSGEALTYPFDFLGKSHYAPSERLTILTKDVKGKLVRDAKANKRFKK